MLSKGLVIKEDVKGDSAASSDIHWCCRFDKTPERWNFLLKDANSSIATMLVQFWKGNQWVYRVLAKICSLFDQTRPLNWNDATCVHTWNGTWLRLKSSWVAAPPLCCGLWAKSNTLVLTKDGAEAFKQHLKRQSSTLHRQKRQSSS